MGSYEKFESHLREILTPVVNAHADDLVGFCKKGLTIEDYWSLTNDAVRDFAREEFQKLEINDYHDILENCEKPSDISWYAEGLTEFEKLSRTVEHTLIKYSLIYAMEMSYPMVRKEEELLMQKLLKSNLVLAKTDSESKQISREKLKVSDVEFEALDNIQGYIDAEYLHENADNFEIESELNRIQYVLNEKIDYSIYDEQ